MKPYAILLLFWQILFHIPLRVQGFVDRKLNVAITASFSKTCVATSGDGKVLRPKDHCSNNRKDVSLMASSQEPNEAITVRVNEFFKAPVPTPILNAVSVSRETGDLKKEFSVKDLLVASPGSPGIPRPLWLVILGSIPTGIVWYGYYKFCVEEELMQMELDQGREPRGFGGYGTLGPFVYGCLIGPFAFLLHLPGGLMWTNLGIIFIYYTQFLLYDRVNDLYRDMGEEAPLPLWWALPIFFPFNLIVGLRQVHYLSNYFYRQRGIDPPADPVVEFFPFIGAPRFTWSEFLLTPSLWCSFLKPVKPIDEDQLPEPVRKLLSAGKADKY